MNNLNEEVALNEVLKRNADRYNTKFYEEDPTIKREILVYSDDIESNIPRTEINSKIEESNRTFVKFLQNKLTEMKEGEYAGILYSPFKKGHVEGYVLKNGKVHILTDYTSMIYPSLYFNLISTFANNTIFLDTSHDINGSTRGLQASYSEGCGSLALKICKTLLSKQKNGNILMDTLPVTDNSFFKEDHSYKMAINPDIAKISQSNKLVAAKFPNSKEALLTVGKHEGESLYEHRQRYLNTYDNRNEYLSNLVRRYKEKAKNPSKSACPGR